MLSRVEKKIQTAPPGLGGTKLASQPETQWNVPPPLPHKYGLMIRAYDNCCFPFIRPATKPLFLGGKLGRGRLTSHDI